MHATKRRSAHRWPRLLIALALPPILVIATSGCVASWLLGRDRGAPRDPATGVMRGAEARTLDPPWVRASASASASYWSRAARSADRPTSAVLLVHGFVGTPRDFNDLPERLAGLGYHVRALRLPGHGTTPQDFARQTTETLYTAVESEYLGLKAQYKSVDVVGFSMGGALSTLLASRQQGIHRLALVSPYYGVRYRWFYGLKPEWWSAALSPLSPVIPYVPKLEGFKMVNRPGVRSELVSYHAIPTAGIRATLALGAEARAAATLGAVRCPTLMIVTDGDMVISPAAARQAFKEIASPHKQLVNISPRSNHHLFWDYDREQVMIAIEGFLGR